MPTYKPPTTSPTLIRSLGLPASEVAWGVFLERYGPLIEARCRAAGLQAADAEDVRSTVCAALVEALRGFRLDPARRFRGYVGRAVDHAICDLWRTIGRRPGWVGRGGDTSGGPPEALAGLGAEVDEAVEERLLALFGAMERVRAEVGDDAWDAFRLTALEGCSGAEAAARIGTSPAAVYMAKSRVLTRLRRAAGASEGEAAAG